MTDDLTPPLFPDEIKKRILDVVNKELAPLGEHQFVLVLIRPAADKKACVMEYVQSAEDDEWLADLLSRLVQRLRSGFVSGSGLVQ